VKFSGGLGAGKIRRRLKSAAFLILPVTVLMPNEQQSLGQQHIQLGSISITKAPSPLVAHQHRKREVNLTLWNAGGTERFIG
jgi:hypothetical protein